MKILKCQQWADLYPPDKMPASGSELYFHFCLASDLPCEEMFAKNVALLNVADVNRHALTPLIIATMKANTKAVSAILGCWKGDDRAKLNQADSHGWSALHHAVVSSAEIVIMLLQAGADYRAKTRMLGSVGDIRVMTRAEDTPRSGATSFLEVNGQLSAISTIGQEALKGIGLKKYRDAPYVPPDQLGDFWQREGNLECQQFEVDLYNKYLSKKPPDVIIADCKELQGVSQLAMELRAGEELPPVK